jgi:hypothetical protein
MPVECDQLERFYSHISTIPLDHQDILRLDHMFYVVRLERTIPDRRCSRRMLDRPLGVSVHDDTRDMSCQYIPLLGHQFCEASPDRHTIAGCPCCLSRVLQSYCIITDKCQYGTFFGRNLSPMYKPRCTACSVNCWTVWPMKPTLVIPAGAATGPLDSWCPHSMQNTHQVPAFVPPLIFHTIILIVARDICHTIL